ncbi:hypothetical protein A3H80_02695 [Candidatus Roizmanbacteria bacterium RIFCSPLOWO2_02_FULL_37_19]|uniref:Small ribosomal subunit protein bS20 n=1 Tax=Candidatus Roizmanbacteria bacterium RIFCSPHIGHO2_02_FULL_37_24 TaxID=1802037 RepID=A0A1F7GZ32_9BACT|nr:MAG: hypothetical protein A2862_00880 [Candidatus Roizmanbacteria bacterium RIFCSPHIGHO2_01_FULL_38_41]OGK24329.1 MAG: hypothetical protein A3C24_02200 [Candidatus Roizmanbacteria bacterium RIFCSPHIGHO2_02_FULL_37_24]OGK32087.1 MAG: hypothetical protein A3E10_00400 [Candidatus Roizmanbacteria bacterium RIFCSPHIGHO2_12_FULL_37_23]OGK44932.1 MAG: hypothetical protein A2956_04990 [Candidatus Roizmanbacteria bacterium RIFCSPLOWO2_01_FULL_37_57]OGK53769.1 MAG: hypothetical protein A3H80_02695 [Ca
MPIIKSAQKKLRQDKKRAEQNLIIRGAYKHAVIAIRRKAQRKQKITDKDIKGAFSSLDKAVKKKIIHANKAARLKSQVSKLAQ